MNTLQNTSSSKPLLNNKEKEIFDALLHPMHMTLMLGIVVFGGGAIMTLSAINGVIPGTLVSNTLGWVGVWLSGVVGFACALGMIFVKPLALKWIMLSRAKNIH